MSASEGSGVRLTGGQIDDMTMALIDAAYDKDSSVRSAICQSLFELGKNQPALVLSSGHTYLLKHSKLPQGHRIVILSFLEKIIKESLTQIDKELAVDLIRLSSEEMTKSKEVVPEWQTAASSVLVAIGCNFCNEVMEELLIKFQPGVLPHFFVVQTMANLASANVYDFVPFLSVVMGTMLPMLGMAKHDNMKWVFSTALSKFCEAILDYVANIEKAPDSSVKKEAFAGHMYSAYDVLFNLWLNSREPKLRLSVVDALGQITHIINQERLQEQLNKLIPAILGLYRKHPDPFHITQGLCMVVDAATKEGSFMLEPHLDQLLSALFPQVCIPVDYGNPSTVKNHNELLRCFAYLVQPFSEKIVNFLLQKLENKDEKIKMGALMVFRHLINASDTVLEDRKAVILSGLKMVLSDNSNKVKKLVAQAIVAMAHHGYLELDGGQLMIEFIVKQCSQPTDSQTKRPADPDYVSNEALKSMCGNVLHLITSTVENMDMVLWPHLLEYISPEIHTSAMAVLCKNLAHLANVKRKEKTEDFLIDFDKEVNVPKPQELTARLLVMVGRAMNGGHRGIHVLHLMLDISPVIDARIVELWDTVVPKLIQYLEESLEADRWNQKSWEDLVLKLVSKSLDVLDDEDWVILLGEALTDQISLYNSLPEEKNFLYKCLGIVMRKSTKKDFVSKTLDGMFASVNHSSTAEREGCAIAFGFCAASHLDAVLHKCEMVAKHDIGKRQSGLMSFFKDQKAESETERMKATLMLCYGFITMYAPPSIVASRLESTILRSINPHMANAKDIAVKQNLMKTTELIASSMHPDHLKTRHTFSQRRDLLQNMRAFIQGEPISTLNNDCRILAFKACNSLAYP